MAIRGAVSQKRDRSEQYGKELREGRWPEAVITDDGNMRDILTN